MSRQFLGALALVATAATGVAAQDAIGREEYMIACAGCHGETAKGDGPLARLITIDTPDLTTLSAGNGGAFPFESTVRMIDGRGMIRIHGNQGMPVWGDRFVAAAAASQTTGGSPEIQELLSRGRILSLVYYLNSIQE